MNMTAERMKGEVGRAQSATGSSGEERHGGNDESTS